MSFDLLQADRRTKVDNDKADAIIAGILRCKIQMHATDADFNKSRSVRGL